MQHHRPTRDGVCPEIIVEPVKGLDVVSSITDAKFEITQGTDGVPALAKENDTVLFGAVGGPK